MCNPTIAANFAFQALSTGAQYMAEKEAVESHNEYMNAAQQQASKNAIAAYNQQTAQETTKLLQEEQAASQEMVEIQRQARRQAGEAIASSNAAGIDLDNLLADYMRQEAGYKSAVRQELAWKKQQMLLNNEGHRATAQSRINQTTYIPKSPPSAAASIASLGLKAAGSYQDYRTLKDK